MKVPDAQPVYYTKYSDAEMADTLGAGTEL